MTSKYIHTLDTALIMAADTISGYIQGLLDGIEFKQTAYALDRDSRKAALACFLKRAAGGDQEAIEEERRLAARCCVKPAFNLSAATGSPNADGRIGAPEFRDNPVLGVNRRSRLIDSSIARQTNSLAR